MKTNKILFLALASVGLAVACLYGVFGPLGVVGTLFAGVAVAIGVTVIFANLLSR